MQKLLNAYAEKSTFKNALAIRAYDHKHPMTRCMLDSAALADVVLAIDHANRGV